MLMVLSSIADSISAGFWVSAPIQRKTKSERKSISAIQNSAIVSAICVRSSQNRAGLTSAPLIWESAERSLSDSKLFNISYFDLNALSWQLNRHRMPPRPHNLSQINFLLAFDLSRANSESLPGG